MKESKGERTCREYFERKFKKKFIRCRPVWLNGLELDVYNEELLLAFEYNGGQHYKYVPHYHKHDCNEFHGQIKRDVDKRKKCANRGIRLIVVPDLSADAIPEFLDTEFVVPRTQKCGPGCCVIL